MIKERKRSKTKFLFLYFVAITMFLITITSASAVQETGYTAGDDLDEYVGKEADSTVHEKCQSFIVQATNKITGFGVLWGAAAGLEGDETISIEVRTTSCAGTLVTGLNKSLDTVDIVASTWQNFTFNTPTALTPGTTYYLAMEIEAADFGAGENILWRTDSTVPTYANGSDYRSINNGAWSSLGRDFMFYMYSVAIIPTINYTTPQPLNGSQFNTQLLNINTSVNASNAFQTELYVNNTLKETRFFTSGTNQFVSFNVSFDASQDTNITYYLHFNDSVYDSNSTSSVVFIDNVFPVITWRNPSLVDTISTKGINLSINVNDANLFRVNLTVYYPNNSMLVNNYSGNLSSSSYNINDSVAFTIDGNYTVEVSATDSHTFGSLNGLQYNIDNKGLTFTKSDLSKRIWFGYYATGNYNFLSDQQIIDYNVSSSIADNGKGEYSWHLNYNKPAPSVKFGFAIEKTPDLQVINSSIGHLVWFNGMSGWYFDFTELITAGYPITFVEKTVNSKDYYVIYTDTSYCTSSVGAQCQI